MKNTGWLKIAIPIIILLGVAGAALVKIMIDEPPGYAAAPRIETRFAVQLSILTELAASYPLDSCAEEEPVTSLVKTLDRLSPWLERIDEVRDRFEAPEILAAEIVFRCGESFSPFRLKSLEGFSLSRPHTFPPPEWPAVSLWYSGAGRFVRYEDRPADAGGAIIRLSVDLVALEEVEDS